MSESSTTKIKNEIKALDSSLELRVISSFTTFIMEGKFLYRCGEHKHNIWTTRHRDVERERRSSWTLVTIALHVHNTRVCDGSVGEETSRQVIWRLAGS